MPLYLEEASIEPTAKLGSEIAASVASSGSEAVNREAQATMAGILVVQPIGALVAGILILIYPRILNYVIGIYLILAGLIGLVPHVMG